MIRVSGPASRDTVAAFAGRIPSPRTATLARIRDPDSGDTLDEGLVLLFEARRSETGEDGVEFHLHGSPAVVTAMLAALGRRPGLRGAEPGEFARRAFANGKMDLAQIEGLADLIEADTEWQRRQAQRQLSGAMREAIAPWRAALIAAAAEVETAIDFAEDVELGAGLHTRVVALIAPVRAGLATELRAATAERVRDGIEIVIAGPPNAGKSSLLNALVRREAAIVSSLPGTTRDPVAVHLDVGGSAATLVDTAGLRESADPIEQIGVNRARERMNAADLVLWLSEASDEPPELQTPVWRLSSKADLPRHYAGPAFDEDKAPLWLPISSSTGQNLDVLGTRLVAHVAALVQSGDGIVVRARHRIAFEKALAALDTVGEGAGLPVELIAEHLRAARFALDRLIGTVDVEDILGDVFSRFCIGK